MFSPDCYMLLQITTKLRSRMQNDDSFTSDDLYCIWEAYKNLCDYWELVFEHLNAPPPLH